MRKRGVIADEPQEQAVETWKARLRAADRVGVILASLPKWGALAVIAWQARLSIEAMTGKSGLASLMQRFDRQTSYWELVCWIAGLAGILYGLYCQFLLHRWKAKEEAAEGERSSRPQF